MDAFLPLEVLCLGLTTKESDFIVLGCTQHQELLG